MPTMFQITSKDSSNDTVGVDNSILHFPEDDTYLLKEKSFVSPEFLIDCSGAGKN